MGDVHHTVVEEQSFSVLTLDIGKSGALGSYQACQAGFRKPNTYSFPDPRKGVAFATPQPEDTLSHGPKEKGWLSPPLD